MMKNIAVVVTYNRCTLLQKAIRALKNQTVPLDVILVINNGSTDDTAEWLSKQEGVMVVTQDNLGGSGGFWRGIKEAYALGADYIWCMDDDVHPYSDCLEQQLRVMPQAGGIVAPQRLLDGKSVVTGGECLHFNFTNPFRSMKYNATLDDIIRCKDYMEVESIAFEGPLISRNVVEKIGLPVKELFIFWDDTEYSYRAKKNGFHIVYASKAHLFKENLTANTNKKKSWKYPYMLRNEIYFIELYAPIYIKRLIQVKLFTRFMLGVCKRLVLADGTYQMADFKVVIKAFMDGVRRKLRKY